METGSITEYRANCSTCGWKGHKFGNPISANAEVVHHNSTQKDHEAEMVATEVTNDYPEMSKEAAKLLFIRKSAGEAYAEGSIKEATKGILTEVVEISTASTMTKEDLAQHIGNLEKAKSFLAAFTQGLFKAHADELEPTFRAKHEKEEKEKRAKAASAKKGGLSASLLKLGLTMDQLIAYEDEPSSEVDKKAAEIVKKALAAEANVTPPEPQTFPMCPTCQKPIKIKALHKCS